MTTRSALIRALHKRHPRLPLRDLDDLVTSVFSTITECLARGDRVELRGFGVFSTAARKERVARNPRTGEKVILSARRVPMFRLGDLLHKRLNDEDGKKATSSGSATPSSQT